MSSVRSDTTFVPNLVETVKGYASTRGRFEKVTQARSMAMQATSPAEMAKAENTLRDNVEEPVLRWQRLIRN